MNLCLVHLLLLLSRFASEDRVDNLTDRFFVLIVFRRFALCVLIHHRRLNDAGVDAIQHVRDLAKVRMLIEPELLGVVHKLLEQGGGLG